MERLSIIEDEVTPPRVQPSQIHVLLLVLHGGNILDTGSGEQSSKQGDVNTIATAFETVIRVHYPAALGRIAIKLVPCPAICSEAFSLVSNLSPYSYDEGCLCSSQDHIPLAALPLLATSSPQYQEAVATMILRANQVYSDFIKSQEGVSFNGQVCLIGDCVGGILAFDALCYSNQTMPESQNSSRRGSVISVQDADLLSPGILVNNSYCSEGCGLEASRHLSRSTADLPRSDEEDPQKQQLLRKRSDSLHSSALKNFPGSRRSSSSTQLDSGGNLGKFEFEISDFFLFGCPLGLVLALRKTIIPTLDIFQLRPACQQVYNLFHPADPSASRLEPLLEKKFHILPPFNIPRYQRFPLGDGNSALLVETVQNNPALLVESNLLVALQNQDNFMETSIPVPTLNWQDVSNKNSGFAESDVVQSHGGVLVENASPSAPVSTPQFRAFRRASEVSTVSQVSGMADSYTASNIANKKKHHLNHSRGFSLLALLALPHKPHIQSFPQRTGGHKLERSPNPLGRRFESSLHRELETVHLIPELDVHEDSEIGSSNHKECQSVDSPKVVRQLLLDLPWSEKSCGQTLAAKWWGTKRIDYALYCPDALTAFPTVALPHLFHASYWESTDVVSFLLRQTWHRSEDNLSFTFQVMRHENSSILEVDGKEVSVFTPSKPREKWLRKRTHVKLRVDIHIMTQPPSGEWVYFDTEVTNSSGRISYMIPEQRRLGIGVYPVKMVVRHWQELGYLIVYVTGRPDMQKQRVVAWLAQHNFPHGIVSFCDGLVHDPLRHKANFLKFLVTDVSRIRNRLKQLPSAGLSPVKHAFENPRPSKMTNAWCRSPISLLDMKIHAAYGSTKDVSVYTSINLSPPQIFIVGRSTKKLQNQCQFITEGYASHLAQLEYTHRSRPAKNTTRMGLRKGSFGLPGQTEFLRKRNHLLRTISSQPTTSAGQSASYRPERTQSQSESERERDRERSQRSMSLATGCWGRSTLPRLEPGNLGQK
ncbi:hypothetical protein Chor_012961 [Crotalus horridus]